MKKGNISAACKILEEIAGEFGVGQLYIDTLSRVSNMVLYSGEDLGMSAGEMISTIRALNMLKYDLEELVKDLREDEDSDEEPDEESAEEPEEPEESAEEPEESDEESDKDPELPGSVSRKVKFR